MGARETDLLDPMSVVDLDDQAVVVVSDVEEHPIVTKDSGLGKDIDHPHC